MWSPQGVHRVFSLWKTQNENCVRYSAWTVVKTHRYASVPILKNVCQGIVDNRILVSKRNKVLGGGENNRLKFCVLFYRLRSRFALKDIAALMLRAPADNVKKS